MNFKATGIPYGQTNSFSKLALDYLNESEALQPFYEQFPRKESLAAIIKAKSEHQQNRQLLSDALLAHFEYFTNEHLECLNGQSIYAGKDADFIQYNISIGYKVN